MKKFGVREICDVTFKAKQQVKIGKTIFEPNQPVLVIDSAKTSTIEGASTTVYAQGGKGNTRLIAWEGEKTLTFTVEDALLSPVGFSILSGAGLFEGGDEIVRVHRTTTAFIAKDKTEINLTHVLSDKEYIDATAPLFVMIDKGAGPVGTKLEVAQPKTTETQSKTKTITLAKKVTDDTTVFIDYYVQKKAANVSELQIDADTFAGNYYVEASTLFRDTDGKDMPAEITMPNVKIQSNFTFSMASTGDPSTFTFTMDAFPGYTLFDHTKKVLCVMQIIDDTSVATKDIKTVMPGPVQNTSSGDQGSSTGGEDQPSSSSLGE